MKQNRITAEARDAKSAAKGSLRDSMSAVAAALSSVPDNIVRMPKNLTQMFLLVDPVLSMIHSQLLDARSHMARIAAMLGAGDPMMEALHTQIAALEEAYATRLAALKRRREEGRQRHSKKEHDKFTKVEEKKLLDVREQSDLQKRRNDILWSWIALMLLAHQFSMTKNGPRLDAA